jgi:hypothetical protein
MKYTLTALALLSIASLTSSPLAEAGGRGISVDMPCPYGPGGDPWTASNASSPFNPGYSPPGVTGNTATLTGTSPGVINQDGLSFTTAVQYDTYAAAIPAASNCSTVGFSAPQPIEQVMVYTLASGNGSGFAANDQEVLFNYDSSLASTSGTASFTLGGVTYTSTGTLLPTTTDNDFLFNSSGQLVGALTEPGGSVTLTTGAVPTGWTASGTVSSAPEMDSSLAISAFTLLAGCLAVARGGRRSLRNASRV